MAATPLSEFQGVIATHKITASAPDRDLPTVQGLRVCTVALPILITDGIRGTIYGGVGFKRPTCFLCVTPYISVFFLLHLETGSQLHHQQQRDSQQK